jgi:hypothetical protein
LPDDDLANIITLSNPFVGYRSGLVGNDNKNSFLHTNSEAFPFHDSVLGLHLVRLITVTLSGLTLLTIYGLAQFVFGSASWLAVLTLSAVAFNPMYISQSGMINNDGLVALASHMFLLLSLRAMDQNSARTMLAAGAVWGVGVLSKMSALTLAFPFGVMLSIQFVRRRSIRPVLIQFGLTTLPAAALAGPWLLRNWRQYGELTGLSAMMAVTGEHGPPRWAQALSLLPWTFTTFWARFGPGFIPSPDWALALFGLLSGAAAVGWAMIILRRRPWPMGFDLPLHPWMVLWAAAAATEAGIFYNSSLVGSGAQGRYLFVVAGPIAALLVAGWAALVSHQIRAKLIGALLVGLFLLAGYLTFGVLGRAFAPPPIYSAQVFDQSQIQYPLDLIYAGRIRLRGYSLEQESSRPGADLRVTLYWEALAPSADNYTEFVQLVTPQGAPIAGRDTHPGLGNYITSRWKPGIVIADTLPLPIPASVTVPGYYDLAVGLNSSSGSRLPITNAAGEIVGTTVIGRVRIMPLPSSGPVGTAIETTFGQSVELSACDVNGVEDLRLQWRALERPADDFTIFVHFLNAEGGMLAQADHIPNNGLFPTTAWRVGDSFWESVPIPHQAQGASQIRVGLYVLATLERLAANDSYGNSLPDAAADLPRTCLPHL